MFCAIYRFAVKQGREEQFREGWRLVTEKLVSEAGSLGARMHRAADGSWIAYAQWPDRDAWERGEVVVSEFLKNSYWDEETLNGISVLFQLEVTDDLLVPETAKAGT